MSATIIVAIVGAFGSFALAVFTQHRERLEILRKEAAIRKKEERERKIPIYTKILDATGPIMQSVLNQREPPGTPELTQQVAMWASTKVLVYYLIFRLQCEQDKVTEEELTTSFSEMVLAIREDLEYPDPHMTADQRSAIGTFILADSVRSADHVT